MTQADSESASTHDTEEDARDGNPVNNPEPPQTEVAVKSGSCVCSDQAPTCMPCEQETEGIVFCKD